MVPGEARFGQQVRRVLRWQLLFMIATQGLIVAGYSVAFANAVDADTLWSALKATGYGGLLGMLNTVLSARSVRKSSRAVIESPNRALLPVFAGLVNKLVIVGGGMAVGMIVAALMPLFVVIGYVVVQIAFVWASARSSD